MRTVVGVDYIISLKGDDMVPELTPVRVRMQPHEFEYTYGNAAPVFIANRNDQKTPEKKKGLLCYFDSYRIIGAIISAKGPSAVVLVLAPALDRGKVMPVDLRFAGLPLQQIAGPAIWAYNHNFKKKEIDLVTGKVKPLTDNRGFVKIDTKGPDILSCLPAVPAEYSSFLRDNWVHHNEEARARTRGDHCATLYIYFKKGWDPKYVRYKGKGKQREGLFCVPVGGPISAGTGTYR